MKETFDNKKVPSRCWYYLLEFNDRTKWEFILEIAPESEGKLFMLTYTQFWELFKVATEFELKGDFSKYDK